METQISIILGIWVHHIESNPVVFGGQRSYKVTRDQSSNTKPCNYNISVKQGQTGFILYMWMQHVK